ncbi:N-acetyltransferase [Lysinibacillus sp. PLM2]|nr:N-acetyltransferase [Lysinibacillus sp. PLM2]
MSIQIRKVMEKDWEQVRFIYEAGIATKIATFERNVPSSFERWFGNANVECTLVAEDNSKILGWCKLMPVSTREVYAGVGEVSIYIHPDSKGRGIGTYLLQNLILQSEEQGFWTLEAKIFEENTGSIQLHKKNGFKVVGIREKIAKLDGVWKDVVFLERRSTIVGTD